MNASESTPKRREVPNGAKCQTARSAKRREVPNGAKCQTARSAKQLLFKSQLLKSTESVSANIGEALGRGTKADRNRSLTIARGEAEESIQRLRTNHLIERIEPRVYWRLHNRLVAVVRMITSLMNT